MTDSDDDDWESAQIPDFTINDAKKIADRKLVEDADNKLTQDLFLDKTKHTDNTDDTDDTDDTDADKTEPIKTTLEQPGRIKHKKERYKHIPNKSAAVEQQRNIMKAQEQQQIRNKHNDIFGEAQQDTFDYKAAEYDTKLSKYMH